MGNRSMSIRPQATLAIAPIRERGGREVDGPQPIIDLFERNGFAGERAAEKDGIAAPADAPIGRDDARLPMRRIVHRGQAAGPPPDGPLIAMRWDVAVEGGMRPLVVVALTEPVEPRLLAAGGRRGRPSGFRFQHAVKLLVRAVLRRAAGGNVLKTNPQAQPPHVEARQAA